jgi:L-methionine (R)-S-oxide reductase
MAYLRSDFGFVAENPSECLE